MAYYDIIGIVNSWSKNSVPHVPHERFLSIGYSPNSWYVPHVPDVPDVDQLIAVGFGA